MTGRMHPLYLDCEDMDLREMEQWGTDLMGLQRGINWWLGDLARAARAKMGDDNRSQAFPPDSSPDAIARWEAVVRAFPKEEDRNPLATWSVHKNQANKPDRIKRVQASVDAGLTSDEDRKANKEKLPGDDKPRWILAIDVPLYVNRFFHSGAGIEAATEVTAWIQRTTDRLKEMGVTDCACCFDSPVNHRKALTAEWDVKAQYKGNRGPKDPDIVHQLQVTRTLLDGHGFACVGVEGYEADDILASFAKQFPGKVTIMTRDKDMRQCLSSKCNLLLDVLWAEDDTTGELLPEYDSVNAKQHLHATGIYPSQWADYQSIWGDSADCIKGAVGIGEKGAADLIMEFVTVEGAIQAAKDDNEHITLKQREILIEFEAKLEITRKLVTLVTDLPLPSSTRI